MTAEERVRRLTRAAIVSALQEGVDGGELIMKEVWEECGSDEEVAAAKDELRAIITMLRGDA